MNIIETVNAILNGEKEMPAVKMEIDTVSVVKACGVVLVLMLVYLILRKVL